MKKLTAICALFLLLSCQKEKKENGTTPQLNGTIVFAETNRFGTDFAAIVTYDVETKSSKRIDFPLPEPDYPIDLGSPKWSFDKSKIIFASNKDGELGDVDTYIMNRDGSNLQQITNDPNKRELSVSLSPDGKKLLYTGDDNGNTQIYVSDINGSNERKLTNFTNANRKVYSDMAVWSPDGSKIYFHATKDSPRFNMYSMNSDGTNIVRIHTNESNNEYLTSVSADGKKLLFYSTGSVAGGVEVFSINVDGTDRVQLTNFGKISGDAAWSPDGNFIAFSSNKDKDHPANDDYYIMRKDGSDVQRITNSNTRKVYADWK